MRSILHCVNGVARIVVLKWIEDLSHEFLPDCLVESLCIRLLVCETLDLAIGIRIGDEPVLFVDTLGILATIDNHNKV